MALPILFVPVLIATSVGFAMLRKIKTEPVKPVKIQSSTGENSIDEKRTTPSE